ncbi:MAG: polyphenol oxidase family protein [Planctomycetota bacterium]
MTAEAAAPIELLPLVPTLPPDSGWLSVFAARRGGVSGAPFESLNLGFSTGDLPADVVENRRRLAAAAGVPLGRCVVAGQTHEARVLDVERALAGEGARAPSDRLRGYDALSFGETDVFALALSADCPIVAIVDPEARCAVVAHAGWRGTVAGVIEAAAARLEAKGGELRASHAGVSPGIGACCYPVGEEVFDALDGSPGLAEARSGDRLELRTIHRVRLAQLGVPAAHTSVVGPCVACEEARFFSHRRDAGRTGRSGVLAGWLRD